MNKKILIIIAILSIIGLELQSSQNLDTLYPFQPNPTLSWANFEKNFRQKYGHNTHIPPIIVNDAVSASFFASGIGSPAAYRLSSEVIRVAPCLISKMSPATLEFILLHETGHHNYPKKLRKQNSSNAEKFLKQKSSYMDPTMQSLQVGKYALTATNAYQILRCKPNIKLLAAQYLVGKALDIAPSYFNFLTQQKANMIQSRPEEIFADTFAAQRADKEAISSFQIDFLSLNAVHVLNKQFAQQAKNQNYDALKKISPSVIETTCNLAEKAAHGLETIRYHSALVHDLFDPAHPSNKDRHNLVQEYLNKL